MNQTLPRIRLTNENSMGLMIPVNQNSGIIIRTIAVVSLYGRSASTDWVLDLQEQQLTLVIRYSGEKGALYERQLTLLPLAGMQHRQPVFNELNTVVSLANEMQDVYKTASIELWTAKPSVPFDVEIIYENVNNGELLPISRMNHLSFRPFLNTLIEYKTLNWISQYGMLTNSLIGAEKKTDTTYALVKADDLPAWRAARDRGDETGMKQYVTSLDIQEIVSATIVRFQ